MDSEMMKAAALQVLNKYARQPTTKHYYLYGTAGFRFEVDEHSPQIFARTGMLAHFRSCVLGGKTIGLCITASHNLVKDNGIKLIDPEGGMLAQDWEDLATRVINADTNEKCIDLLFEVLPNGGGGGGSSSVLLARDTRESSEMLERCASEAIAAWNGKAPHSLGLATTPQLHYCVMERNHVGFRKTCDEETPTLETYNKLLCESYTKLVEGTRPLEGRFAVDCSNGIGGLRFAPISSQLKFCEALFNVDDATQLNLNCGAEYVQKEQKPPANLPAAAAASRFASFDGDADRVVCFYLQNGKFHLLDGDKIASLFTLFIKCQLDAIKLDCDVTIGTVQTAYANGSSTRYLGEVLKVDVPKVKTGVKHLHHKAQEYDVGVYFEANGHGTVLFKPEFVQKVEREAKQPGGSVAAKRLFNFILLLNQATGDAIADVLAVDAALRVLEYKSFDEWNALYTDLPSKQCKVKCQDRSLISVNEDETRCIKPAALQLALDSAVQNVPQGRVFVRPSGTENVIRVYAEASTSEDAQRLAQLAERAICEHAGGVSQDQAKRVKM